jgi:hypothetical protein
LRAWVHRADSLHGGHGGLSGAGSIGEGRGGGRALPKSHPRMAS